LVPIFKLREKEHANLDALRDLLNPYFDIKIIYVDGNPVYKKVQKAKL